MTRPSIRHPDADTLAAFRHCGATEFAATFVQVPQADQHLAFVIPTPGSRTPDYDRPVWRRRAPGRRARTAPG